MMKFPYQANAHNISFPAVRATEKRESQPFSDSVIQAIVTAAEGTTTPDPSAIGALEAAAGLYAACFAAANVEGAPALTPAIRALLARDLIRRGESCFRIVVEGGALALRPAGSWDVRGGPAESAWYYRLDEFGPSGNMTYFVASAGVVHARYAVDPSRPWYGLGPLQWASATGTLAAGLETRLGEEAGGAVGHFLPYPQDQGGESEGEDDRVKLLKADIRAGKGRTLLVETLMAGLGEGRNAAPAEDWKPRRFGANPPVSLPTLRTDAGLAVLAACGVPAALVSDADGTAQREAWRRFAMGPLAGMAAIVEAELTAKLERDIRFDFAELWAHDQAGRAAAFAKLVQGGMDIAEAARLSGVVVAP